MRFLLQLYSPVLKDYGSNLWTMVKTAEELGIINQKGLSRKVRINPTGVFVTTRSAFPAQC